MCHWSSKDGFNESIQPPAAAITVATPPEERRSHQINRFRLPGSSARITSPGCLCRRAFCKRIKSQLTGQKATCTSRHENKKHPPTSRLHLRKSFSVSINEQIRTHPYPFHLQLDRWINCPGHRREEF